MQPNNSTMEIYIRYEEYLTASQLRQLLKELDRMYEALYCGLAHCDPRDIGLQSQLRVSEVRTGDSITLLLAEGVRTVADSDAVIHIPVAVGALSVAALVLVSAAKGIVQLRKTWHEGTKAKYEGRKARHEADSRGRQFGVFGDALHFQADQVVGQADRPQLLHHALRLPAPNRLFALEEVRLHLIEAKLDLPALVVQRTNLVGRVRLIVEHRRQKCLRSEARSPIRDGSHGPIARQVWMVWPSAGARSRNHRFAATSTTSSGRITAARVRLMRRRR